MLKAGAIRHREQSFLLRSNYELPLWSGLKRFAHNLAESSVPGIPILHLNTIRDGEEDKAISKIQYSRGNVLEVNKHVFSWKYSINSLGQRTLLRETNIQPSKAE